jgi:hypothetical protein
MVVQLGLAYIALGIIHAEVEFLVSSMTSWRGEL